MTTSRRLAVFAAAALSLVIAGCGTNTCPTESAKIASSGGVATGVPTCADIQAGAAVTVKLGVCPRCDQTYDACNVTLPTATDGNLQLDPLVQVCQASNSCPAPSCAAVTCTFTAPAAGSYSLLVYDPDLGPISRPFTVVNGGTSTSCGG